MKNTVIIATGLVASLLGTGCATKKYVAKVVTPVEQRVAGTENKNGEQDRTLATQGTQIEGVDKDLSATKGKLTETDAKAIQAGEAARTADQKAGTAQQSADRARQTAEGAVQGVNRVDQTLQALNKFNMAKSETILFAFDKAILTEDARTQLNELANQVKSLNRYVIEIQGFTDKTGLSTYNDALSQRRALAVARFLANEYKIPLRNISVLGSGYAQPVGDDKKPDGRKMNRRVEIRLWVPESESRTTSSGALQ